MSRTRAAARTLAATVITAAITVIGIPVDAAAGTVDATAYTDWYTSQFTAFRATELRDQPVQVRTVTSVNGGLVDRTRTYNPVTGAYQQATTDVTTGRTKDTVRCVTQRRCWVRPFHGTGRWHPVPAGTITFTPAPAAPPASNALGTYDIHGRTATASTVLPDDPGSAAGTRTQVITFEPHAVSIVTVTTRAGTTDWTRTTITPLASFVVDPPTRGTVGQPAAPTRTPIPIRY